MKKWTNYNIAEDLVECLESFYSEESNGLNKLPKELSKYSGLISVALSEAKELKDNLKNDNKEDLNEQ